MDALARFLSGQSILVYIAIFFGKLIEVALASLRSQLIVKGQRLPGAIVSLVEYAFWLIITASVLADFSGNPLKIIILVVAFAAGQVVGSYLEEKLAFGYCTVTAIFQTRDLALSAATILRSRKYALTLFPAEGMLGAERIALMTAAKRKDVKQIKEMIFSADHDAVLTVQATQQINGATFLQADK